MNPQHSGRRSPSPTGPDPMASATMLFALGLCVTACCHHSLLYCLIFCFAGFGYYTAQLIRDCD